MIVVCLMVTRSIIGHIMVTNTAAMLTSHCYCGYMMASVRTLDLAEGFVS